MSCIDQRVAAVAADAPPHDLSTLVARIRENHAKLHGSIWIKIQIGGDLVVAKKLAGHGHWLTWVRENCGLGGQTIIEAHAQRNPQRVSHLTLRSGLRLIATDSLLRAAVAAICADSAEIFKQLNKKRNVVAHDCAAPRPPRLVVPSCPGTVHFITHLTRYGRYIFITHLTRQRPFHAPIVAMLITSGAGGTVQVVTVGFDELH